MRQRVSGIGKCGCLVTAHPNDRSTICMTDDWQSARAPLPVRHGSFVHCILRRMCGRPPGAHPVRRSWICAKKRFANTCATPRRPAMLGRRGSLRGCLRVGGRSETGKGCESVDGNRARGTRRLPRPVIARSRCPTECRGPSINNGAKVQPAAQPPCGP